jgi:DNA-binding MarR family transcriptional regulator
MVPLDPEKFEQHYPQLTYEAGLFMVDYLRRLNREFENDIATAIVLGEIAQHSVRDLMKRDLPRSGLAPAQFAVSERFAAGLKRCNALSVAESSGIPRETVRRKIDKLVKRGFVTRDADGGLTLVPGVGGHFRSFDRQTVADLLDLAERVRAVAGAR